MEKLQEKRMPLPSDPIVIEESPSGPVPFLTRFARKPNLKIPLQMGNQTAMGTTQNTGPGIEGDWLNDDQ